MATYDERRDKLAIDSSILVQVFLGHARADMQFIALKPRPASAEMWEELRTFWPGRGLRSVGFIGLAEGVPRLVLNEPLDAVQVEALAVAFAVYVATLVKQAMSSGHIGAEIERAEIAELNRMWSVPDSRYVH